MADNYKFIECPACGKTMKKVFLEKQGFIVDICLDGCGGLWLDNRELSKIDNPNENITPIEEAYTNCNFKKVDSLDERICPLCKTKMVKNNVSAKQEILIDECYSCGGKFFDYKELDAMRAQYENDKDRVADVLKLAENKEKMILIFERLIDKN